MKLSKLLGWIWSSLGKAITAGYLMVVAVLTLILVAALCLGLLVSAALDLMYTKAPYGQDSRPKRG